MNKERYTVSDIIIESGINYNRILAFEIISQQGEHGRMSVLLEVPENTSQSQILKSKDSNVTVTLKSGTRLFAGICYNTVISYTAGYNCVRMEAYTKSMHMDMKKKKTVFQDPAKTLQGILEHVCMPYNALLVLDSDPLISSIEYQQDETDWNFLKRLAALYGKAVFTDIQNDGIIIYCGEQGFRRYSDEVLGRECEIRRDMAEFARAEELGNSVSGYMYDTKEYLSAEPGIAAGDVLTNHDRMVKLGETALTITATRKVHESNSSKECLTD